jgi:hypothetical protein
MKDLDDFLTQDCNGKFKDKTWLLGLFGSFQYTPTGEKADNGFRYFACDVGTVLTAFRSGNVGALLALPFALDADGEADTSAVAVTMRYTASGSAVALQVEEHRDGKAEPRSEVWLVEGAAGQAVIAQIKQLDQST